MIRPVVLTLLVLAAIASALLIVEGGLRWLASDPIALQVQWGVPDDAVEARARTEFRDAYGTFTYDEHGFRVGDGQPYDRSVLFIGDSFTEGWGVGDADTFARATERALRAQGISARSLNAGQRGFGAAQELKVLRRVLERTAIDALVVQSFPMNDLSDNLADGSFGIENGRLVEHDPPRPPLRARLSGAVARSFLRDFSAIRLAVNAMLTGDPAAPYDGPTSFDLEAALLTEIVAAVRRRGIPIVMLVVPTKHAQQVLRQSISSPPDREVECFTRVRTLVMQMGVPWIDAGEVIVDLEADAAKGDGGHFSRDGNALIGQAIATQLHALMAAPPSPNPEAE